MSNPTANSEATPADLLAWTNGRALIATGSPFEPVVHAGKRVEIGQGNNVLIFPALGLGALVVRARKITDAMITAAARSLAEQTSAEERARGCLYPNVARLRSITRLSAAAVARAAIADTVARSDPGDLQVAVDAFMWRPEYPTFV